MSFALCLWHSCKTYIFFERGLEHYRSNLVFRQPRFHNNFIFGMHSIGSKSPPFLKFSTFGPAINFYKMAATGARWTQERWSGVNYPPDVSIKDVRVHAPIKCIKLGIPIYFTDHSEFITVQCKKILSRENNEIKCFEFSSIKRALRPHLRTITAI